jgi:1,2-phenylacetyl-CoA epoxidase catalytic subunit
MIEITSGEALEARCRTALRNLLSSIADTKLLLGYHYGEWTFGTPVLEASIANCSLSQTELGHVRLLHGILKSHFGEDPERLMEGRPAGEIAGPDFLDRDLPDWAALVAATLVLDGALTLVLYSMRESAFLPVRNVVEKMLEEERYHAHHGRGWFRALAGRGGATRKGLKERVEAALRSATIWWGPEGEREDLLLVEAGIKNLPNSELASQLRAELGELGAACGVELDTEPPVGFDGWNPRTRRSGAGAVSEEILYHMRGSKNQIFKLT